MAHKPIDGADAVTIRKWIAAHEAEAADDAERDEAIEREEIIASVSAVLGPERLDNIVLDVFNGWMAALAASRRVQ